MPGGEFNFYVLSSFLSVKTWGENLIKYNLQEKLMGHLGVVLYEYLGEEYPEVLGSILGALKAIVNVIGMTKMTPPIKDLLPRLTPILKNRHEKVSNCFHWSRIFHEYTCTFLP